MCYVDQHIQYLPFGELFIFQQNSKTETRYKFSAKERDNATGYTYFGARYYDSDASIFISVDPLASKYPSMSSYMYVAGNPVVLIDPNGMEIDLIDGVPDGGDKAERRRTMAGSSRFAIKTKAGQNDFTSGLTRGDGNGGNLTGHSSNNVAPKAKEHFTFRENLQKAHDKSGFLDQDISFFDPAIRKNRENQAQTTTGGLYPERPPMDTEWLNGNMNPEASTKDYNSDNNLLLGRRSLN